VFLDVTHIALPVPAVPEAEEYYASLLGLDLVYRDICVDGEWFGLQRYTDWRAADGATARISVLARGALVLVLSDGTPGSPHGGCELGLRVTLANLNDLRIRVAEHGVDFSENAAGEMRFADRLGVRWHVGIAAFNDPASMGTGARAGRWWPG